MLVRREFWQHPTLRLMPLMVLGLLLLVAVLGLLKPGMTLDALSPFLTEQGGRVAWSEHGSLAEQGMRAESLQELFTTISRLDPTIHDRVLTRAVAASFRVMLVIGCLVLFALLGQLFEREVKDRSSLFFTSMPISSTQAIGAKLAAFGLGLLLLLGALAAAQVLVLLVTSLSAMALGHSAWALWQPLHQVAVFGHLLLQTTADLLWWLPALGAIVLRMQLGRPAPGAQKRLSMFLLTGTLTAIWLDKLYLSGGGLWHWLKHHFMPPGWNWSTTLLESTARQLDRVPGAGSALDLWTGVLLGVAMLWLATKARDWREE